jgi:hypothetical protein
MFGFVNTEFIYQEFAINLFIATLPCWPFTLFADIG